MRCTRSSRNANAPKDAPPVPDVSKAMAAVYFSYESSAEAAGAENQAGAMNAADDADARVMEAAALAHAMNNMDPMGIS